MNGSTIQRRGLDDVAARFLTGDAGDGVETREEAPAPAPAPAPAAPAPATGDLVDVEAREHLGNLEERVAALIARGPGAGDEHDPHPLAQYRDVGDFVLAAYNGDADSTLLTRAWADQVTGDSAGINRPAWLDEVRGIVDLGRRMIAATGGALNPGTSGMSVEWPYFDGDLSALIGIQAAQKTEITSVKVPIKKGSADLRTFAGGSDIALQVIERGSPEYLSTYSRIMLAAYALTTDAAFCTDLLALAGVPIEFDRAVKGSFEDAVVEAALEVEAATGSAPTAVGIGRDIYASIANERDAEGRRLYPFVSPGNADGTISRAGLTLEVAGLPAFPVAGLAGHAVVTNGAAARWAEDGPRSITAPEVPKLGRDVAFYGYGDTTGFVPRGVVALAPKAGAPLKK